MAVKMNVSVIALLMALSFCFCSSAPTEGDNSKECSAIQPNQRVKCAKTNYGRIRCLREGCCFDRSVKDAIRCFKPNDTKAENYEHVNLRSAFFPVALTSGHDKSTLRSCVATPRERVDCGWPSITQQVCESRGCCFDRSSEDGPRCFQPESLLIGRRARKVLECTWECTRQPWRKIAQGYSRCSTNAFCWMELVGQSSGTCLTACKMDQEIDQFLSNVSDCLDLDFKQARDAKRSCDSDLPCWIDSFGYRALTCFKMYEQSAPNVKMNVPKTLPQVEPEHPQEEEEEDHRREETSPEIVDREVPVEPGHIPTPPVQVDVLRTDINVERSVSSVIGDQRTQHNEEEGHEVVEDEEESYLEEQWYE